MLILAVGPSNCGKTHYLREWVLPTLLTNAREITYAAPPDGMKMLLIADPRSRISPSGQYPGARYEDAMAWRRSPTKSRVSCFDQADAEDLCKLAYEQGDTVVVLDEIDLALGHGRRIGPWTTRLIERGRHDGIALVGTCRRLHAVRPSVRANCQVFIFGNLSEPDDRAYAARTASVDERKLSHLAPRVFLEYRKEHQTRLLTRITNGRRVVLDRL